MARTRRTTSTTRTAKKRTKTTSRKRRRTSKPAPYSFEALPPLNDGDTIWTLDIPWEVRPPGATYVSAWKTAFHTGPTLPDHLAEYASAPHTFSRMLENRARTHHGLQPRSDDPTPPPMRPRPDQIEGVRAIARHAASGAPQYLLADDTGVGKTLTAVLSAKTVAKLRQAHRILVVADRPAQITIPQWASTINAVGDDDLTWCVITWDHLKKVAGMPWDIIIADEAQALRHQDTKRWGYWTRLSGMNRKTGKHPYLLMATATPGHNPLELGYLAPTFAHATSTPLNGWVGKDNEFAHSLKHHGFHVHTGRYGWQWSTDAKERARDITQLTRWQDGATIHRDAPWGPVPISATAVHLDATQRHQYEQDWGQFCADMELAQRGNSVAKGRAAILRLRQKASMLRIPTTVEWVQAQLDKGYQVVVSVDHVSTAAEPICTALTEQGIHVARIYGTATNDVDVEAERISFQTGQAPVVITTKTASINLQAGEKLATGKTATPTTRVGVMHQAKYSGIAGRQVVGRTHRNYQRSPWTVHYGKGTVEEDVARLMVERYAASTDMVGGDTTTLTRIAQVLRANWMPLDALTDSDVDG